MRKDVLIESIRGVILGREDIVDDTKKLHPARVEYIISQAYEEMIFSLYGNRPAEIDMYTKRYFNQSIQKSNGCYYVTPPAKMINAPNGRGVRNLRASNKGKSFIPVSECVSEMYDMPFMQVMDQGTYRIGNVDGVTGDVIVIEYFGDGDRVIGTVDFGLIRPFESFGYDEDIHLPRNAYSNLQQIVLTIIGQKSIDDINNGK